MSRARRLPPGVAARPYRRKDGTETTRYSVRWIDATGAKRRNSFESIDDARDFLATVQLSRRRGTLAELDRGQRTLNDFIDEWWRLYAVPNLEPKTLEVYATLWNRHGRPRLGHHELRGITPKVVAAFRRDLESEAVGPQAIRKTMTILQGVFSRAVEWEEVPANPFAAVRKPSGQRRRAVVPLAPATVEGIRAHLINHDAWLSATLVSVLAYAGLRPEEALALEWRHVREQTLLVEQANANGRIKPLKTGATYRTVDLLEPLREDLAGWHERLGADTSPTPVFPNAEGAWWAEHDLRNWRRRYYQPAARASGTEPARPYDLRHSFASLMLREGRLSLVELAAQLGHAPTMTLSTYAHVMAEYRGDARVEAAAAIWQARAWRRDRAADQPQLTASSRSRTRAEGAMAEGKDR